MCQSEGSREKPGKPKDIHAHILVLELLNTGQLVVPQKDDAARIKKQAKMRAWTNKGVVKKAGNGLSARVVPLPANRLDLIREAHEDCGHFGVKRTESLLVQKYTWPGLREDMKAYIGGRLPCKAANAKFQTDPQLHSIVVESKSWTRVGINFAGPFPVSVKVHDSRHPLFRQLHRGEGIYRSDCKIGSSLPAVDGSLRHVVPNSH